MVENSCPACPHTCQGGPFGKKKNKQKKKQTVWCPVILLGRELFSFLCLLVIDTALASALSFSTIEVSFDWNSSPSNVFFSENSSEPNLLQEGSIAVRIFSLQNCEVSSEAFPTRQIVRWIKLNASVAGTAMSGLSFSPASRRSRQAAVSGLKIVKIAAWIFVSCASFCFPRYSAMYLSTLGTVHTSASGLGCSLNRASRSSLVRHRLRCLQRYVSTDLGITKVPSLFFTSSVGSNRERPLTLSLSHPGFPLRPTSDASPEVGLCPLEAS